MQAPPPEYARAVELQVDVSIGSLGAPPPITISEEDQRVLLQQVLRWRVAADVLTLAHGTYKGKPASLIGLQFTFGYRAHSSNRLSSAEVTVTFLPDAAGDNFPTVKLFAPTNIHAKAREMPLPLESLLKTSTFDSTPFNRENLGPAAVSAVEHGCDIDGGPWTSDEADSQGLKVDNAVTWDIDEHKEGIPRRLRTVAVVCRTQSTIRARIKVRAKTNWGLPLFGSLWQDATPLVIKDSVEFGDQPPPVAEFSQLSSEQLGAYVGIGWE